MILTSPSFLFAEALQAKLSNARETLQTQPVHQEAHFYRWKLQLPGKQLTSQRADGRDACVRREPYVAIARLQAHALAAQI